MTENTEDGAEAQPTNENSGAGCGAIAAGAGCLVAFAPLVMMDIRVSGFALMVSAPIGIVIAIVGFVIALSGAASGPATTTEEGGAESTTNLAEMTGEAKPTPSAETVAAPIAIPAHVRRWNVTDDIARRVFVVNIVGTVVVTVATAINMTVSIMNVGGWDRPLVAAIATGQFSCVLLAGWLLIMARRVNSTRDRVERAARFAQLERVQRVVGVGSSVWLVVLLMAWGWGAFGSDPIVILAGLTPTIVGATAMILTLSIREKIEAASSEGQ